MSKIFKSTLRYLTLGILLSFCSGAMAETSVLYGDDISIEPLTDTRSQQLVSELFPMESDLSTNSGKSFGTLSADGLSFSQAMTIRGMWGLSKAKSIQVWGNIYYVSDKLKERDNIPTPSHNMMGGLVGLNYSLGKALTITGYYNYNDGKYELDSTETKQTTHLGGLGLYYSIGSFYMTGLGTWGTDGYKITENTIPLNLDTDGWQSTGLFEVGYDMRTRGLFSLKPFTGLQYSYLRYDEYQWYDQSPESTNKNDALYYLAGARVDMNLAGMDTFTVQGRLAWIRHLSGGDDPVSNYWFSRIPGMITPTQVSYGNPEGKDYFWLGVGLRLSMFSLFSLTADYDANIGKDRTAHIASLGVLMSF